MTTTAPQRPGGLTAICILAIVLGVLGILAALGTLAAAALQDPMQNLVVQWQHQENKEAARVQQQINDETREFAKRHIVRNGLFSAARLLVASGLLAGSILTFRLRTYGRKILLAAFAAGIAFELAQIWPAVDAIPFTQRTIQLSMEAQQIEMQARGQNADDVAALMRVMTKAIAAMQVVMVAGMLLAKAGFYAFGLWYLTTSNVAALFIRPATIDPQWA